MWCVKALPLSVARHQPANHIWTLLTIVPGSFLGFKQRCKSDVILWHNSVQHIVWTFGICHCQLVEFHQMFLNEWKSVIEKTLSFTFKQHPRFFLQLTEIFGHQVYSHHRRLNFHPQNMLVALGFRHTIRAISNNSEHLSMIPSTCTLYALCSFKVHEYVPLRSGHKIWPQV